MTKTVKRPELPDALRYLRQALGLTQEEVAFRIKVARQMLISWEAGQLFPTEEHFGLWKAVLIKELERVQIQPGEVRVGNRKYKVKIYAKGMKREQSQKKEEET
jgi:transcriptional regulator with XRE-family HTH domain